MFYKQTTKTNFVLQTPNIYSISDLKSLNPYPTAGVPNLGYMYPWGYICWSEGVHLREKYIHFQIF